MDRTFIAHAVTIAPIVSPALAASLLFTMHSTTTVQMHPLANDPVSKSATTTRSPSQISCLRDRHPCPMFPQICL